jgi:iron complex transport system substrate-binding protein
MRILSLQPSVSLILEALGRLDTLVGCTKYCVDALPALGAFPIVRDSWSSNTAEILALQPDLVIASVPYRQESLTAILKAGLPVLALAPHCLADIYGDIRLIGAVVESATRASAVVAEMQTTIASVCAMAATAAHKPRVYCEEWGKPLIHSQPWVKELVEAAGGIFVGEAGATTTSETIAAADPEVIVLAWCGAGDRFPVGRVAASRGWHGLRAVKSGRAVCISDELLNTPAPTLIGGLQALAGVIHPELFGSASKPAILA